MSFTSAAFRSGAGAGSRQLGGGFVTRSLVRGLMRASARAGRRAPKKIYPKLPKRGPASMQGLKKMKIPASPAPKNYPVATLGQRALVPFNPARAVSATAKAGSNAVGKVAKRGGKFAKKFKKSKKTPKSVGTKGGKKKSLLRKVGSTAAKFAAYSAVSAATEMALLYAIQKAKGGAGLTKEDVKDASLNATMKVADKALKGEPINANTIINASKTALKDRIKNMPMTGKNRLSPANSKQAKVLLKSLGQYVSYGKKLKRDRMMQLYNKPTHRAFGTGLFVPTGGKKGKKKPKKKSKKKSKNKKKKKGKKPKKSKKKKPKKKKKSKKKKGSHTKKMSLKKATGKYRKMMDVFHLAN